MAEAAFEIDVALRRGEREIALTITAPGGLTALVGHSGAGKTSILDMIAGLLTPRRGRVAVRGQTLFDSTARVNVPAQSRACGYVFQDLRLFNHMRVVDNLLYGWRRAPPERRFMTLDEATDFLALGPLLARWPATLSGGEAQRVAIGRALLAGPRFLLMDEPLSALDTPRRAEVMAVIARIRDDLGLPILYVSHQGDEVAQLAGMVINID